MYKRGNVANHNWGCISLIAHCLIPLDPWGNHSINISLSNKNSKRILNYRPLPIAKCLSISIVFLAYFNDGITLLFPFKACSLIYRVLMDKKMKDKLIYILNSIYN